MIKHGIINYVKKLLTATMMRNIKEKVSLKYLFVDSKISETLAI